MYAPGKFQQTLSNTVSQTVPMYDLYGICLLLHATYIHTRKNDEAATSPVLKPYIYVCSVLSYPG